MTDMEMISRVYEGGYNLFDEVKSSQSKEMFLEHALRVYIEISERHGTIPRFTHLIDFYAPRYEKMDGTTEEIFILHEEFENFCRDYLMDHKGKIPSYYTSVEDYIEDQLESNYYELDIFYTDDLLKAWETDLSLFFIDETKTRSLVNEPIRSAW